MFEYYIPLLGYMCVSKGNSYSHKNFIEVYKAFSINSVLYQEFMETNKFWVQPKSNYLIRMMLEIFSIQSGSLLLQNYQLVIGNFNNMIGIHIFCCLSSLKVGKVVCPFCAIVSMLLASRVIARAHIVLVRFTFSFG